MILLTFPQGHTECSAKCAQGNVYISRSLMARALMARLPWLTRARSWVPMISYMRLLWSNLCIIFFMLLFSLTGDH